MIHAQLLRIALVIACAVSAVSAATVTSFTLVNADTNADIGQLVDGDVLDLTSLASTKLNVRASISGTAAKVNFALSGAMSHTQSEGVAPYALFGDSSGNYNAWTPVVGDYSLSANCDGTGTLSVSFSVVESDGGTTPPDPDPTPPPSSGNDGDGSITISGIKQRWHRVTLNLEGPWADETTGTNPFTDYRMTVTFTKGSLVYTVPGYFAADG
ncbi:MAG: DUF5060 domain-containing protein, partial [Planctomycetota bacterium]|nr:DUF5060 domain-containing protein [Planctomycetota bacterium]